MLLSKIGYESASDLQFNRLSLDDQDALDELIAYHLTLVRDYGGRYQLYPLSRRTRAFPPIYSNGA